MAVPDAPAPSTDDAGPRAARSRRWVRPFAVGVVVALVAAGLFVTFVDRGGSDDDAAQPGVPRTTPATQPDPTAVVVYEQVRPSLVLIQTRTNGGANSLGSGVIVNAAGQILTALHVVDDAASIEVTFADGTRSAASVTNADPEHDIAVLASATGPQVVVPAVLGGGIRVGDDAYPVGNPLGLVSSITAGVVSGLNRSIPREDNEGELTGLIQFDAAVNPGSSGGPLFNRDAQVVGIVTALANPTRSSTFIGIGFAVPIGTATAAAGGVER